MLLLYSFRPSQLIVLVHGVAPEASLESHAGVKCNHFHWVRKAAVSRMDIAISACAISLVTNRLCRIDGGSVFFSRVRRSIDVR